MYTIYADGVCIYNDVFALDNMKVVSPRLTLEDNAAGSLTVKLPPANLGYETITRMVTDISVRKNGEEIWAGRVLSESKDFWNNRELYCEGELAFFNDSSQPPAEYTGLSIRAYLERLIAIHNSKVAPNRQFVIGAVTVADSNFPTYYTNYEKTVELLNALIERYGGHIRVRKVDGVRYLDYLAEYPDTCSQTIQFGTNLIEFTRQWDSTEFATVIVPLGARLDKSPIEALDAYLTVESVNNGSIYLQSDEAVAAYGWIEKTVAWNEVDDPAVLLEKARAYLQDLQFDNMEIELSALDLHYLDVRTEAVKLLDEIRVISRPHGLDRLFPVTSLEIPLDSPEQTVFKLGDTVKTSLTSVNNQTSAAILKKIEELPKAHNILKEAKDNATAIMNMATTGYITITKDEHGSEELIISNVKDYTKADKLWKWNMNGFGYSNDGGKTFGLAMTMDGSIVADFITTGTLNANIIRAGTLRDIGGNFILDMATGKLTMKKGSISLGEYTDGHYNFEVDNEGNLYARRGTFAGTLSGASGTFGGTLVAASGEFKGTLKAAKIYGDLVSDPTVGGWIRGCGISVGGKNWQYGVGNFYVDSSGNVTMAGSITMAGNITWSTNNSPCQVLYAYAALSTPYGKYTDFPSYSYYDWHRTFNSSRDYYASYTYDGGNTWTSAIKIRGEDGEDGRNGSDASVTRDNIYRAMLNATWRDGIYSSTDDRGNEVLLIRASAIKTGIIDAERVYLQGDYGGFCQGEGDDGTGPTTGAKMYGSDPRVYVIATNAGARMTAGSKDIFVTRGGCHASEEFIIGSDRRIKNGITYDMDKYVPFFMALRPTAFRRNNGTSNRFHIGFIAQDVEDAILSSGITTEDFAGFVRSSDTDDSLGEVEHQCYLRYDNFIALNTFMIQSALKEIRTLKEKIQKITGKE